MAVAGWQLKIAFCEGGYFLCDFFLGDLCQPPGKVRGSGGVAVIPLDRGDQGGSNGTNCVAWRWRGGTWERFL
jgi:hypothetical protein